MKKPIGLVLYATLAAAVSLGQTASPARRDAPVTNPLVDRAERMSKRFPAELVVPAQSPARLSRSYCVSRSTDAAVTMKPCEPQSRKFRLAPALQTGAPSKP